MAVSFKTTLGKYDKKGEKTGWTYLEITQAQAHTLNPGRKTSFRVKGKLDSHAIVQVALLPMGDGSFIIPFNAKMRKATGKKEGDTIAVHLSLDKSKRPLSAELVACLETDPDAKVFFNTLSPSHQSYFSKWIEDAATSATRTKRLVMAMDALSQQMGYSEMFRHNKRS